MFRGRKRMRTRDCRWPIFLSFWQICLATAAAYPAVIDSSFFAEKLYPALRSAQCDLCHNDNGVASETELEFPEIDAGAEQLFAFGLQLMDLVDREHPEESRLFLMPTNREDHTGGERIKQGSLEEQLLLRWINHLASLSKEQIQQARETIDRFQQRRQPAQQTVRRLTHSQYNHTVRDLLGDQTQPANRFPKEDFIHGFKNQIEGQGVSPIQAEAYSKSAERLARSLFRGGDLSGWGLGPERPLVDQTAESFIRHFGRLAFRRPLTESELNVYTGLFEQEARRVGVPIDGARLVVETMLQSPHFLFRIERGPEGPHHQYELASRLSYFLWDTMPSNELLDAAQQSRLATAAQVEQQARIMLEDPRARSSLNEFLAQWMRFDRVLSATRDRRRFRQFNPEIAAAMVEETRRLFNYLAWEDRSFMEFFAADYTFVSRQLAEIYDLPVPAQDFDRVDYPTQSGRSGVLGHGSFLVLTSKPAETSPTERGLFVRSHFLGHEVPPPPPGVNAALPDVTEDTPRTNRQRLEVHLNSEACSSCHRLIDPIGLGFEQYDAIGRFQEKMSLSFAGGRYNSREKSPTVQLDINSAAFVQGIENSEFSTPKELGHILANNEACQKCVVKQLFRYTFGRQETVHDRPLIDGLFEKFQDSGFRFRELMVAIVTSDSFLQPIRRQ